MKTATKGAWIRRTVLFLWLVFAAIAFGFVFLYGSPLPFADEWANFSQAVGKTPVTLQWLWSLHNEHRLPLFRLVYVGLVKASGNDFRSGMMFNVFVLAGLALTMIIALSKIRGKTSITDAFFPICLTSLGHFENLLFSNQIQFILITVFLSAILLVISSNKGPPGFRTACAVGIMLILLPLCGTAGLIVQVPVLFWFSATSIVLFQSARLKSHQVSVLILLLIVSVSITAFYFVNYNPVFHFRSYHPWDVFRGSMEFLSTSFGPAGTQSPRISAAISATLIAGTASVLVLEFRRRPDDRIRTSGLMSLLAGLLLMMLSAAIGRSGGGPGFVGAYRYATLTAVVLSTAYISFTIYGGRILRYAVPALLLGLVVFTIPENVRIASQYARGRLMLYQEFCKDIAAYLPAEALATRNSEAIFPFYSPVLSGYIRLLQDYRIGAFAELNHPLPEITNVDELTIPLTAHTLPRSDRFRFTFQKPRFLAGFRPSFVIENSSGRQSTLFIFWRSTGSKKHRRIRFPLNSSPQDQTYSFWIYDAVSEIELAAPHDRLQLKAMTILLDEGHEGKSVL